MIDQQSGGTLGPSVKLGGRTIAITAVIKTFELNSSHHYYLSLNKAVTD